jgi:hypothetical protein
MAMKRMLGLSAARRGRLKSVTKTKRDFIGFKNAGKNGLRQKG